MTIIFFVDKSHVNTTMGSGIAFYPRKHTKSGVFTETTALLRRVGAWFAYILPPPEIALSGSEKERRFEIFKDNLYYIIEYNSNSTFKLGLNRFAGLSNEEYRSMLLGGGVVRERDQVEVGKSDERYKYESGDKLPEFVDWRDKGAVGSVKDQGHNFSGGSWAFSATGSVEGINHIVTGELIPLSEQELVDCDEGFKSSVGVQIDHAFEFIVKKGGIHTVNDYPYKAVQGVCDQNVVNNSKVVTINGYGNVPQNDEYSLKKAVAHQPVSVSIEAGSRHFQLYKSGVFNGICGTELDHGVVAIGYGTEDGRDYWIVRNSWGTGWGENGYMRLERNVASTNTGKCGIAMRPSYPTKKPLTVCNNHYSCPESTTCCCVSNFGNYCYGWECCPVESATCCDDRSSCCPPEFPVCDTKAKTCLLSKDGPIGVKALGRSPARPNMRVMITSRKLIVP
ncbi:hypothetical protein AgCh_026949 [Apium graveolens]